jgi:hypothetical protein
MGMNRYRSANRYRKLIHLFFQRTHIIYQVPDIISIGYFLFKRGHIIAAFRGFIKQRTVGLFLKIGFAASVFNWDALGPSPSPVLPWQDWQCFAYNAFPSLMDSALAFTGLVIFKNLSGTGQGSFWVLETVNADTIIISSKAGIAIKNFCFIVIAFRMN